MGMLDSSVIWQFLEEVGRRYPEPAELVLLGGGALCLLGSIRPTIDLDYVGDDLSKNPFQQALEAVANQLRVIVEAVPIEGFIPLPAGGEQRRLPVGTFGSIVVTILDPYAIALSKLDRGAESDIEDIVFLLRRGLLQYADLEVVVQIALRDAQAFSLDTHDIRSNLALVRSYLK